MRTNPNAAAPRTGAATPRTNSRLRGAAAADSTMGAKVASGVAARTANRTPVAGVKATGNMSARAGAGSTRPGEAKPTATGAAGAGATAANSTVVKKLEGDLKECKDKQTKLQQNVTELTKKIEKLETEHKSQMTKVEKEHNVTKTKLE